MIVIEYQPVRHDHKKFLTRASKRKGFKKAYDSLAVEYALANQMLASDIAASTGSARTVI